ncbi:MAG: (4Fe-4S)-binding protein [Ruminococcaceae bacterium]|nr:(4Fe-4S)-binding protein [Oscillospiraceae bacterium]
MDIELFKELNLTPQNGKLTEEQIAKVKGLGCLSDKRYDNVFNVRVITGNGKLSTKKHKVIIEAADRFGSGEVALTSRMTFEIQGVEYNNIPSLISFLKENGIETGGTGPKVRPIVSCKGTTCRFGLIDTFSLSEKIHKLFYIGYHNEVLPHKFKIGVGGCPNNCVKPDLNDLGVIGQRIFTPDTEKCRGCAKCVIENSCPMNAAKVVDGKIKINPAICNKCGRCYLKCPFGVFSEAKEGYKIFIGGRWGKKTAMGKPLSQILESEEEVLSVIERAICLFRDEGIKGERFADTIERLGFGYVEEKLLGK